MDTSERRAEILRALRVFIPDGQITELRAFPPGRGKAIENTLYRDLEAMAERAIHLEDRTNASGIYFVLNPGIESLLGEKAKSKKGSLNAEKIARRRWLPIDVDPVRIDEHGQILEGSAALVASTDEEHNAAWSVISTCRELLDGMGLTGAVVGDSGNGWHLCYPIDLPNDQESYNLISECLTELDLRCGSDYAHVDQVPKDAPRVWKLYGTLSRKSEQPTEQRPHRRSWLVEGESPTQAIRESNNETLCRLVQIWRDQRPKKQTPTLPGISLVERAKRFIVEKQIAIAGDRGHDRCWHVACTLVWGFALSDMEAFEAIGDWNRTCNPPWSEGELQHKFDDARKSTNHAEPFGHFRDAPWEPETKSKQSTSSNRATSSPEKQSQSGNPKWRVTLNDEMLREGDPSSVLSGTEEDQASQIRTFEMNTLRFLIAKEFKEPNWIIPGIMSEGLNILAGAPKHGKSMIALNTALTVAGGGMALGNIRVDQSDVLYLSLEDKQRRVKQRALKMLTAMDRDIADRLFDRLTIATDWPRQHEGGLRLLDLWCQRVTKPGLIIIDVWNRFTPIHQPGGSAYAQDSEYLGAVKQFADRRGLTILVIHHTRKQSAVREGEDYIQEVSGTLGITGAADGILVLIKSRQDNQASLHVTGRDVVEQELVLEFDVNTLTWKSVGTAAEHIEGRVRKAIVQYLRGLNGESAFATDIAAAIGEKEDSVRKALGRLRVEKIIRKVGNAWSFPGEGGQGEDVSF